MSWYRQSHKNAVSVALGDSPNDFPMLERADYPILVRSQRDFSELKEKIPNLKFSHEMGPLGWNEAIMDLLESGVLD
jgi:mannosyl-3-phosphoglycerate phosphatase